MMLITFGIHLYEICTKNVFYNMTKKRLTKKLGIPRKLKTETHKQLKIRTDMNSDAPYESADYFGFSF
jgi:hypothetical protein